MCRRNKGGIWGSYGFAMRRWLWILGPLAAACVVAVVLVVVRGHGPSYVWSDEFDGPQGAAPNPRIWRFATGGAGWGNSELECYTDRRANAALDGHGHLVITARRDPGHRCADGTTNDYTSARLLTQHRKTFEYGHIRVRAKLPTAPGTWPAIWALGIDHDTAGWPNSGEIDIVEKVGSMPTIAHGTLHGPDPTGGPYSVTATTAE